MKRQDICIVAAGLCGPVFITRSSDPLSMEEHLWAVGEGFEDNTGDYNRVNARSMEAAIHKHLSCYAIPGRPGWYDVDVWTAMCGTESFPDKRLGWVETEWHQVIPIDEQDIETAMTWHDKRYPA